MNGASSLLTPISAETETHKGVLMNLPNRRNSAVRVLYSFPHKLGADRICYTAWQQVKGLADAGADILAFPGVLHRPVPQTVKVRPTLSWGRLRISYKLLGTMRALALHDYIVSRRIEKLAGQIDIIHVWPDAALETLKTAAKLGIPTVLERPNAHTRYAYEAVQRESKRLGVILPPDNEYAYKVEVLCKEEEEFRRADFLLCPSDFTIKTFLDLGFKREKLLKHQYGFDDKTCYPDTTKIADPQRGLTMLFAGDAAVRKGVHFALEAWLQSSAHHNGTFMIAGNILPAYAAKLSSMLSHPSVKVLGHRKDVPDLMRKSDIFVLPSIEEGFGLVCVEAIGCGCVPLVSEACTDICKHMENALVHRIGDVKALTEHINALYEDRTLLGNLRTACLKIAPSVTWGAAGVRLQDVYREAIVAKTARIT
jgi:glycosyltransferase involved in cell wall biosynthesis